MPCIHTATTHRRTWITVLFGSVVHLLPAQQIDLSLHPTAVPDSFVVRARSTEGVIHGVPNAVFTIRWEIEAGGEMNNGDVQVACGAYTLLNYSGMVDIGNHRYFPLVLMGDRPAEQAGCAITTEGIDIAGLRIRELSGCRHVQLVQNAYTGMNNLDYYFSMGGIQMTGQITSDPIAGGECGPCEPPVITSASAVQGPGCNGPIELTMEAEGDALDISWYGLYSGLPYSYQADHTIPSGPAGPFLLVVNGACGADTVMVPVSMADSTGCISPEIISATYTFGLQSIGFHITATGTCLQYVVVAPNGMAYSYGSGSSVHAPNYAGTGEYLAITYNTCGADTAVFWFDEILQCTPAQVVSTNFSVPTCQTSPLTLSCTATGPGPIGYQWMDPFGTVVGTSANATVPEAMAGDYSITVSNACGSNWALVPVVLDTAGVGACVPPQIVSISTNGPICAGDTLLLQAEVIADGPCLSYQWSGANVVQSAEPTTMAPAGAGNYTLTASNACGSASMSVQAQIIGQHGNYVVLCSPSGLLSLDSIMGISLPAGAWSHGGVPHAGYYDPAVDTSGYYYYHHDPLGCLVATLSLWEYDAVYAGADTSITVCSSDEPFELFDFLGPDAMPGGTWSFGMASMDGIYDPQVHGSHTYQYRVINGGCNDIALVHVTEIPATPWYADTDGDGYGDPSDELLACEQPDGYVPQGGDTCPNLPGLMGDACDDGDPATVNDVINEECNCAGEIHTGVDEHSLATIAIWPNPNPGDVFYLQLPQTVGMVQITITDATGRVVLHTSTPASSAPMAVQLPGGMAAGTYFVGIVSDAGAEVKRLVVGR